MADRYPLRSKRIPPRPRVRGEDSDPDSGVEGSTEQSSPRGGADLSREDQDQLLANINWGEFSDPEAGSDEELSLIHI